jgi:hypothetical protein
MPDLVELYVIITLPNKMFHGADKEDIFLYFAQRHSLFINVVTYAPYETAREK